MPKLALRNSFAAAAAVLLWIAALPVGAAEPEPARAIRYYDKSVGELWSQVLALAGHLGILGEATSAEDGVFVSKFTALKSLAGFGLKPPPVEAGLEAVNVQFHLFVPQTLQKARVVVGAIVSARPPAGGKRTYLYGVPSVENWFLDQLDTRINKGVALSPPPPDCQEGPEPDGSLKNAGVKVSDVAPRYSGSGTVELSYVIDVHGTVHSVKATGGADEATRKAAAGAVSLWRYEPSRLNNCVVPVQAKAQMTFHPPKDKD